MRLHQTKKIALVGLLIALAYISLYFIRIPIIPSASFLRFDIKDVFIVIIGILFGPMYAFVGAVGVSMLQMLSVSEYGIIGLIMNIVSVSAYTLPVSLICKKKKNAKNLIAGLLISCCTMITAMLLWNYLITPLYMGVTREVVKRMLLPVFLPFNLIKSLINAVVTYILFMAIQKLEIVKEFLR